eukprot:4758787-Karenia_brevis.AAC.1
MSDGAGSCPSLLKSDDDESRDPLTEMCKDSPRSTPKMSNSQISGTAQGSQQSSWQPDYKLTPPPPPPPPPPAKVCNPQEDAQMQQEMGRGGR